MGTIREMSDRLLKESDVQKIAFQLPYVVNSAFFEAVKALPSAEPKPEKWILTPTNPDIHRYKCSICNRYHRERYDFCLSCGKRMLREDGE